MIRRIVTTIALCSLGALNAQAQPASPGEPGRPEAPGKGRGPDKPSQPGKPPGKGEPAGDLAGKPGAKGGPADKDERQQERIAKLKERIAQLRKDGKDKQAEVLEKQVERLASGAPGPGEKSEANRQKVRQARKLARVKLLQRRYGESLKNQDVRGEVELHARRSAHLSRMKELVSARADGDDKQKAAKQKMVDRINRLMARENARHSRTMAQLTKQKDKLAGKPAPAPEPANPAKDQPKDNQEEGQE
jgi:hypothetical protein